MAMIRYDSRLAEHFSVPVDRSAAAPTHQYTYWEWFYFLMLFVLNLEFYKNLEIFEKTYLNKETLVFDEYENIYNVLK